MGYSLFVPLTVSRIQCRIVLVKLYFDQHMRILQGILWEPTHQWWDNRSRQDKEQGSPLPMLDSMNRLGMPGV